MSVRLIGKTPMPNGFPNRRRASTYGAPPEQQEPHDTDLAATAATGNEEAFRKLYARHVGAVYARLTRLVGPSPDREDLLQQVFWAFYQALPNYRGEAPVGAFLHGIVTRIAYQALRKRKRAPTEQLRDIDLDRLIARGSPEMSSERRAELRQLFGLLDQIKPKKRIAFVLHVVEELPLTEIAAMTDSQPRTVGQRVAAARREMQRLLDRADRLDSGRVS